MSEVKDDIPELPPLEMEYEERILHCSPIAHPLASKKLTKKIMKVVKKASKQKQIKRGVKEVVKGLRKGVKGVVVIAGDIAPIDVVSHLPVLCEDNNINYVYVPSKEDLGAAGSTKRPTSVVLIVNDPKAEYAESYDEVASSLKEMNEKMIAA